MPDTRNRRTRAAALVAATGLLSGGLLAASPAPAVEGGKSLGDPRVVSDNLPHPLKIKAKRDAQRQAAMQRNLERVADGQAPLARTKNVELERRGHRPDLRRARRVR